MPDFMDYDALLLSERTVALEAPHSYERFAQLYPVHVELLMRLPHYRGTDPAAGTVEQDFHVYSYQQYVELPYLFRSVYILWERGFYVSALTIVRSLVEKLVQVRYFHAHKSVLKAHLSAKRHRERV